MAIDPALLRQLQLSSAALPVGSFAYSQGLEWAVETGWATDSDSTAAWLHGQLTSTMCHVDIPLLARLYEAESDMAGYWDQLVFACRETAELRAEERHRGQALQRMLRALMPDAIDGIANLPRMSFVAAFALAARYWNIPRDDALAGYLWSWLENQVLAIIRLAPLGQIAGQRLLVSLSEDIPAVIATGLACADEDIGTSAPGIAIASCAHESQYTRLFRS
ncbi:MAG: urease accessory protein UreF [Gammaproteobacteria bacterium]|nr:urease accessory protein UreF [Gammaproteobacteria bacterium]